MITGNEKICIFIEEKYMGIRLKSPKLIYMRKNSLGEVKWEKKKKRRRRVQRGKRTM